jgi:hypothetical protein
VHDIRVRIFIDGDAGGGVRAIDDCQAGGNTAFGKCILHLRGDVVERFFTGMQVIFKFHVGEILSLWMDNSSSAQ